MSGLIKKIIKLCLTVIGVAVIFVVAIAGIFIATFDANHYKQDLSDIVRDSTGRDLQFYGDVELTFYPALGMELGALSLSNAVGFGSTPMIKVDKVSISVDVASVIAFSPEIDELILDGLKINLQNNNKGVTNWDDFKEPQDAQSPNAPLLRTEPKSSGSSSSNQSKVKSEPMNISGAFGGLNITNAELSWVDAQAGSEYLVQNLTIKTGRITPEAPFDLKMQVVVKSKGEINADIDLATQIQYWFDNGRLNLTDLVLNVSAAGEPLPLGKIQVGIASELIELNPQKRSVSLKGLVLKIDDNAIKGNVTVSDTAQPVINFKLASNKLDIDALIGMTPVHPSSVTPKKSTTATESITGIESNSVNVIPDEVKEPVKIILPMDLLRIIQADGELVVKQLTMQNLLLNDINLGISTNAGIVNLDPIRMNLYDGSVSGQVRLDVNGALPKYRVNKKIQGVQIGALLTDLNGEDRINGVLNANVSLSTQGEWLSVLKKNSNGDIALALRDGAVKGFNIRHSIDKAKAKLKGDSELPKQESQTDFSSLELSGLIKKGVFISNDLKLQAPIIRVSGEGQVDLNNETVNYLVNAKLVGTIKGQDGGAADDLSGLLLPVRIDGPLAEPKIDVQLDEMLKKKAAALKAKLKAQLNEKKAALKKRADEEKAKLKAKLDQQKATIVLQKATLQKKIDKEKAKLKKIKRREIENKKKLLEAKIKAKSEETKKKLLNSLFN
jgi:AsmA protein